MAPIPSGGHVAGMPFDSITPRDVGANAPAILVVQNASKALGVFRPPERAGLWLSRTASGVADYGPQVQRGRADLSPLLQVGHGSV